MGPAIEKELAEAGYRMLGTDESKEKLILSILRSGNIRYLKAIPFLIYRYKPDIEKIYQKTIEKRIFGQIIAFTQRIFGENNLSRPLPQFSDKGNLNYGEFKQEFELQTAGLGKPGLMIEKQKIYAERNLQMWLSNLFTKKEKQIIRRIMEEKPVSRTDYEYYSRKTKKKLSSILNLQDFARTLYAKTPRYDMDLFNLKKKLEKWLEDNSNDKDISIAEYFIWDNDKISISFRKKDGRYPRDQIFNASIKLKDIKDEAVLNLLNKYKKHDFR